MAEITEIKGVGPKAAKTLIENGFDTVEKIANATPEELSALPGIGTKTAEKFITNAKEILKSAPAAPAPAKKEVKTEPFVKEPPKVKKVEKEVKKPTKPAPKKKAALKPKKKEPVSKPKVEPKKEITIEQTATQKAMQKARPMPVLKTKKRTKAKTKTTPVTLSKTYGVIKDIIHDKPGKSKNKSVILKLYETDVQVASLLGRKVHVLDEEGKIMARGTVFRLIGKKSSVEKKVVVRMRKNVSAHVLEKRALVL